MRRPFKTLSIVSLPRMAIPILLAVSLAGCSTWSEAIKEAKTKQPQPAKVVVAEPAAPAAKPDIPPALEKCLKAKAAAPKGATADDTVKALLASDRTKADCAGKLFAWYRQQGTLPEGHPKTGKAKPAATWD